MFQKWRCIEWWTVCKCYSEQEWTSISDQHSSHVVYSTFCCIVLGERPILMVRVSVLHKRAFCMLLTQFVSCVTVICFRLMLNDKNNFGCIVWYTMTVFMQSCQNVAALFQTFFYRHFVTSIFPNKVIVYTFMQSLEVEWKNKCIQLSYFSAANLFVKIKRYAIFTGITLIFQHKYFIDSLALYVCELTGLCLFTMYQNNYYVVLESICTLIVLERRTLQM